MDHMLGIGCPTLPAFEDINEVIEDTRDCLKDLKFNQRQGRFLVEVFEKVGDITWVWRTFAFGMVFTDEEAKKRFRCEFKMATGPAFKLLLHVLEDGRDLLNSCIVQGRKEDWLQKAMKRADSRAMFEGIFRGLSWSIQVVYEQILDVLERSGVSAFLCQMHRWDVVLEDIIGRLGREAEQDARNLVDKLNSLRLQLDSQLAELDSRLLQVQLDRATVDPSTVSRKSFLEQDRYIVKYLMEKLRDENRPFAQDRERSSTVRGSGAGANGSERGAEKMPEAGDQEGREVLTLPSYFWVDFKEVQTMCKGQRWMGEGSGGTVYGIERLREPYVAKVISSNYKTFTTEGSILAYLRHPNILQLINCSKDESNDNFYLVMERMKQNLHDLIKKSARSPPFSLNVAVDIMLQIARAMEYLHQKGVMHRDLKSLNVLIESSRISTDERDGRVRIKVADFGLSKVITDNSVLNTMVGTSYWRAPEVFSEEKRNYRVSADVYSFAMTCYEILTGNIPFDGLEDGDLRDKICQGDRPEIPDKIPVYLSSCLQSWWAGNPSDRPTFPEICRMLQHLQKVLQRVPTRKEQDFLRGKPEAVSYSIFSSFVQKDVEELISIMGYEWCENTAVGPDKIPHHLFQAAASRWRQGHPDSHQQELASSILPSTLEPEQP